RLLIGGAVILSLGFLERRELEDYSAFDRRTLSHTESTILYLVIRWCALADMPALSAYTCMSLGSWTDSRSATTTNADMDLLTRSMTNHDLAENIATGIVSPCRLCLRERKDA